MKIALIYSLAFGLVAAQKKSKSGPSPPASSGTLCPGNAHAAQVSPGTALNVSATGETLQFRTAPSSCSNGPYTVLNKDYWHVFNTSVGPVLRGGNGTYISGNLRSNVSIPFTTGSSDTGLVQVTLAVTAHYSIGAVNPNYHNHCKEAFIVSYDPNCPTDGRPQISLIGTNGVYGSGYLSGNYSFTLAERQVISNNGRASTSCSTS